MTTLALTLIRSLPIRFPQSPALDRLLLAGAGVCATAMLGIGSFFAYAAISACDAGQSLLVYPHYSRKGIVTHYKEQCGVPHASCVQRAGDMQVYDCSPFAMGSRAQAAR